jgi:sugar phosphate isomerase/epimerase
MSSNTTRRNFLAGSLASATATLGEAQAPPPARAAAAFKLGIASYSFREFQRGLMIRTLKQLKIENVCIKEFHLPLRSTPQEIRQAVREFKEANINIVGGGVIPFTRDDDDDIRLRFEYAKAAGMPLMTIDPSSRALPRMEKFVKEYDIKVAIHNHGKWVREFKTPDVALTAVKDMDPRMGICLDVGYASIFNFSPVEVIRTAGARLLDVHMTDQHDPHLEETACVVGDGVLPVVGIFKELQATGYRGSVNLEYEIEADNPVPGIAASFGYMRGVVAALHS